MALRAASLYEKVAAELLFPWGYADFVSLIHQQIEREWCIDSWFRGAAARISPGANPSPF
jgi:hypothetical protein